MPVTAYKLGRATECNFMYLIQSETLVFSKN